MNKTLLLIGTALWGLHAGPALAKADAASPPAVVDLGQGFTLKPLVDFRLRYEDVERDAPLKDGDALTARMRSGAEISKGGFSALVEAEATLGIAGNYDAFPFAGYGRDGYGVIPDPNNIELNRAQVQYKSKAFTLTAGRQRINIDDQRFVGSVGWRQNEQTFDAVRGEAKLGPLAVDATYSWSQRTIFGVDAGPRQAYDGDFVFLGAGLKAGPVAIKGFGYLLDYNETIMAANSSQTYGVRAVAGVPLGKAKLSAVVSYARQSDYGSNPYHYAVDYIAADLGLAAAGFGINGGYEKLGSDNGRAVQTPMATLHKFNGTVDMFLTTPANGLQDYYATLSYKFAAKALHGLNAAVTWHRFDSDVGDLRYGTEWDGQIGAKLDKRISLLAKYGSYNAKSFGADTRKVWLELDYSL